MPLAPGTRFGPYEITSQLGAGGMGEVYRAVDTRLGRSVAIKTLNADHLERFEREARAIAALNHPNICQLYDIGDAYLVMEFIDGTPLLHDTHRESIPPDTALRYAVQIASALEAAHAKGITHRDLKPANIMVTGAGIKLLDFGLAKLDATANTDNETITLGHTVSGTIVGTAAYMAPEQADGKAVDARSDIFSFGAVLYEMLAGRRAFSGGSAAATMGAILYRDPEPLHAPPELQSIVARCLQKRPEDRFQSAGELRAALELAGSSWNSMAAAITASFSGTRSTIRTMHEQSAVRSSSAVSNAPSIAVLPFANMSGDSENEYFSDGLAEELISALAQIQGLKVIARTSAFAFKGKNEDVRQIADALGVTNVLEGSVRRSGNRVRIHAQLIRADDGTQLWSQRFDREMTDVFEIQDELSQAIAAQLKLTLTESPAPAARQTTNIDAYESVLAARHAIGKFTPTHLDRAYQHLQHAISLDPNYAYAHAMLAEYFVHRATVGTHSHKESLERAETAALHALELDPHSAEAHSVLGLVNAELRYDWAASDRHYLRALELNPASASAHFARAYWCLRPTGRLEECLAEIDRALELDPLSAYYRFGKSYVTLFVGNLERAAELAQWTFDLDPSYFLGIFVLSYIRALQGRAQDAIKLADRMVAEHGRWSMSLLVLGTVHAVLGNRPKALEVIEELKNRAKSTPCSAILSIVYAALGDKDEAFAWAARAIEERDNQILSFKTSPVYNPLRGDPRYQTLLAKMNLV
ncbi:MAG: protein kinase [Bryobacteraceae bacterium]